MNGEKRINKFYEALSREVDAEVERILDAKFVLISEQKEDAAKWCQNRMMQDCVPQGRAAAYLKEKHGMEVVLLPEPELFITLFDPS